MEKYVESIYNKILSLHQLVEETDKKEFLGNKYKKNSIDKIENSTNKLKINLNAAKEYFSNLIQYEKIKLNKLQAALSQETIDILNIIEAYIAALHVNKYIVSENEINKFKNYVANRLHSIEGRESLYKTDNQELLRKNFDLYSFLVNNITYELSMLKSNQISYGLKDINHELLHLIARYGISLQENDDYTVEANQAGSHDQLDLAALANRLSAMLIDDKHEPVEVVDNKEEQVMFAEFKMKWEIFAESMYFFIKNFLKLYCECEDKSILKNELEYVFFSLVLDTKVPEVIYKLDVGNNMLILARKYASSKMIKAHEAWLEEKILKKQDNKFSKKLFEIESLMTTSICDSNICDIEYIAIVCLEVINRYMPLIQELNDDLNDKDKVNFVLNSTVNIKNIANINFFAFVKEVFINQEDFNFSLNYFVKRELNLIQAIDREKKIAYNLIYGSRYEQEMVNVLNNLCVNLKRDINAASSKEELDALDEIIKGDVLYHNVKKELARIAIYKKVTKNLSQQMQELVVKEKEDIVDIYLKKYNVSTDKFDLTVFEQFADEIIKKLEQCALKKLSLNIGEKQEAKSEPIESYDYFSTEFTNYQNFKNSIISKANAIAKSNNTAEYDAEYKKLRPSIQQYCYNKTLDEIKLSSMNEQIIPLVKTEIVLTLNKINKVEDIIKLLENNECTSVLKDNIILLNSKFEQTIDDLYKKVISNLDDEILKAVIFHKGLFLKEKINFIVHYMAWIKDKNIAFGFNEKQELLKELKDPDVPSDLAEFLASKHEFLSQIKSDNIKQTTFLNIFANSFTILFNQNNMLNKKHDIRNIKLITHKVHADQYQIIISNIRKTDMGRDYLFSELKEVKSSNKLEEMVAYKVGDETRMTVKRDSGHDRGTVSISIENMTHKAASLITRLILASNFDTMEVIEADDAALILLCEALDENKSKIEIYFRVR